MATLSKKELRRVGALLNDFCSPKALLVPKSIDDLKIPEFLARKLELSGNRTLLMTDLGFNHFRTIVSTIHDADVFDGMANYADVYGACRGVFEESLSRGERPDDANELIDLVRLRLSTEIGLRTFAVPIFGLELVGIDSLELGAMRVVPARASYLDVAGVRYDKSYVAQIIAMTKARLWLIGSSLGTASIAQEKFRAQAELAVGMLAVSAASIFKQGASAIRIGVAMSDKEAYGRSGWLSWMERERDLMMHLGGLGSQTFKIDADLVRQFNDAGVFARAFALFQTEARTPLEEAITRAVHWYSDAHREAVPVMKLVKYWSCVEAFFSADKNRILQSVTTGLAAVLVFGGFEFVPLTAYAATKKRIVKLYDLRSLAVHGASLRHVSELDAANLSQWVAWMLLNMVSFVERGYTQVEQIKEICERLDAQSTRSPDLRTPA